MTERVKIEHISKSFSANRVLTDVSVTLLPGEIRALIGENGAGKSTLMNVFSGVLQRDQDERGRIYLDGEEVNFSSPHDAIAAGIGFVHQELSIFADLSVAENIFVGQLPIGKMGFLDKKELQRRVIDSLKSFDLDILPTQEAGQLSVGNQQMLEILRAISLNVKVMIFDEPTSSLSEAEAEKLFSVIRQLKKQGVSIFYITHRLSEIFEICDTVSVLRDGVLVADLITKETTPQEIVNYMVGREVSTYYPPKSDHIGEKEILKVKDFKIEEDSDPISFTLHDNEILGFYGLIGAGRTELFRSICGIDSKAGGQVFVNGQEVTMTSYKDALQNGITYLTEDRKGSGLFSELSVEKNIYVSEMCKMRSAFLDLKEEKKKAEDSIKENGIKTIGPDEEIRFLSGGNQQKVLLARCLRAEPKIIILDEPTRGVDVNAKAEIHRRIRNFSKNGMGVIVISSEMPEIMGLSDEIVVMHEGKYVGTLSGDMITEQNIISYATELFAEENE